MKRIAIYAARAVLAVSIIVPAFAAGAQSSSDNVPQQPGNHMGGGSGMMGPGYGMQQGWMGGPPGMMPGYGPQGPRYGSGWDNPGWHQDMHQWMQNRRVPQGYGGGHQMAPGYHMGPGMGYGMMGPGMMAPGHRMGPGMMYGPPMYGYGQPQVPDREVTPDDVRAMLEQRVAQNPNLKVGKVETQDGRIVAEVVTKEGSLVNRFEVDPETGLWIPAN